MWSERSGGSLQWEEEKVLGIVAENATSQRVQAEGRAATELPLTPRLVLSPPSEVRAEAD